MASESFLSDHWEKLVFVASLLLVGGVLMAAKGSYFEIPNPGRDIENLERDYSVAIAETTSPVEAPALVGVESFTARMGGGDEPDIRLWTFYDYKGFETMALKLEQDPELRLPRMALEADVSVNTGNIKIRWKRDEPAQSNHPRPAIGGKPAEFDLAVLRQDLAQGGDRAVEVFRGAKWELSIEEELGVEPRPGVPAVQPGRTYRYTLELSIRDGLKLAPGATQKMTSGAVEVTTPVRYSVESATFPSKGSKELTVGILGTGSVTVRVKSSVLNKCIPIPVPEEQQEQVGSSVLPFRPVPGTRVMGKSRPLPYFDLQRSIFGIHYPVREVWDSSTAVPPGPGGGEPGSGEPGEDDGGANDGDQPPGQPEDVQPGDEDEEDEFPMEDFDEKKPK